MPEDRRAAPRWDGIDRRGKPTPFLSRYSFWGGRRTDNGRRDGESQPGYVDLYSPRLWALLLFFLCLNLLDSHFTMVYLQRGGAEANPIALWLLELGPFAFLIGKGLGVGFGALLFCILKNFPSARKGVMIALLLYQLFLFLPLRVCGGFC